VPRPQHSDMFGQRASSQIVWRLAPWISFLTSKYWESGLGARTFIHSGRRGRCATGSEVAIRASLEAACQRPSPQGVGLGGRELGEREVEDVGQRGRGVR